MVNPLVFPNNCPQTLWHYTSIDALFNIVKTRIFRATHFSFLNDANEIKQGTELVLKIFIDMLSNTPEKEKFQKVVDTIHQSQRTNIPFGYYIVSFSKEKDFTTQWQAYTPPEGGCAIGFKSSSLVKAFSGIDNVFNEKDSEIVWWGRMPYLPLCECLYRTEEQLNNIRKDISKTAENLIKGLDISRSLDNGSEISDKAYLEAHGWDFLSYCVGIKDGCFKQENEWRLVYIEPDFNKIKYNEKQRPYIELKIGDKIKFSDIISEIMISPRGNKSETRRKLEFLRADIENINNKDKQPQIIISDSSVPLRY